MFAKIKNSWALAQECWRVLMLDKEMVAFPMLSVFFNVIVLGLAYFMMVRFGIISAAGELIIGDGQQWILWTALAATGLMTYFVSSYFHAALVACAIIRFRGEDPTIDDGLSVASKRLLHILVWSFISIVFGVLFGFIQGLFKSKFMRSLVGSVLETGWNVLTVFVVPLIVAENLSSLAAVSRSRELLKQGWGESLSLEIGFSWLATLTAMPIGAMLFATVYLASSAPQLAMGFGLVTAAFAATACLVFSALNGISKAAMYNFANGDRVPDALDKDVLGNIVMRSA